MPKEVLIIGGGVIGLCSALFAARKGHQVTVLDERPADHEGCSYGNAGMIVPSHFVPLAAPGMVALGLKWMWNPESPFYVKPRLDADLINWGLKFWQAATPARVQRAAPLIRDLSFASRALFEEFAQDNNFGLVKKGLLMLCKTEHAFEDESKFAEKALALGVPAESLDAKKAAALDPNIRMDIAGAVYFPKDCHLSPQLFMAFLKRELARLNVRVLWNTKADKINRSADRISSVESGENKFRADEYVVACGSWTPKLCSLPMQAGKGYSLTLTKPRQLPKICAIFSEARMAITPMGNSLRFGGTMEIAGLNEKINPRRIRGIIKAVPQYYPEFKEEDFANIKPWVGLRPCSPDGLPYLGRSRHYNNLTIATGHAMMGLSLGPITGQLVSEIISREKLSIDISLLNPERYG